MTDPAATFFKQLAAAGRVPVAQAPDNAASFETLQTRALLEASVAATEPSAPRVKSFAEIHAAMLLLKADCHAFCIANGGTNYASDAVAGLCDLLADHACEFEAELPTSAPPAEYRRAGGQGSV